MLLRSAVNLILLFDCIDNIRDYCYDHIKEEVINTGRSYEFSHLGIYGLCKMYKLRRGQSGLVFYAQGDLIMANRSFKRWIIIIICAAIIALGGYCLVDYNEKPDNLQSTIILHMIKNDPTITELEIFSRQEFGDYLFAGFEYSSNDGSSMAAAIFHSCENGNVRLFDIIRERKCARYAMDIYEKTVGVPTADGSGLSDYRLILIDCDDVAELISIDQHNNARRYSIDSAPCLVILMTYKPLGNLRKGRRDHRSVLNFCAIG